MIKTGIDIVQISRLEAAVKKQPNHFQQQVFTPAEWQRFIDRNQSWSHLAGLLAAKEAIIKAWQQSGGQWLAIEIGVETGGAPVIAKCDLAPPGWHGHISIAHDGDYAIAISLWQLSSQ